MERLLSGMERLMYVGSEHVHANPFACLRIRGPLDPAKLRLAIDELPRKHSLLAMRVIRKPEGLMFTTESVPPIPLRVLFDDGSGQSFLKVAAQEVLTPLDRTNGPLVRFTLVRHADEQGADLIIAHDHTIADATACLYAMRDLLGAQGSSVDAAQPPIGAGPQSASAFSVSVDDLVIGRAELASAPTQELARRCREHGVTVHAVVCAAFASAFAATCERKTKVAISSPVSYRHRLDPAMKDTVCCAIAFAHLHVELAPPKSIWEQAREVRQQLTEWSTDQKLFGPASELAQASQIEKDDTRFLEQARQSFNRYDFSLSNFGRQPIPSRYGALTITAVHGAGALPGEIVITLATLDETMHITWMTRGLSRAASDAADQLVAAALARLGAIPV